MKKRLALVLTALFLVISCSSFVAAQEVPANEPQSPISPRAEIYCVNGNVRHIMVSWGVAIVHEEGAWSNIVLEGCSWKCANCTSMVATEFNPLETGYIGKYTFGTYADASSVETNKMVGHYYGGIDGETDLPWNQAPYFKDACVFTLASGAEPTDPWSIHVTER